MTETLQVDTVTACGTALVAATGQINHVLVTQCSEPCDSWNCYNVPYIVRVPYLPESSPSSCSACQAV
jgi:hypothetical protein